VRSSPAQFADGSIDAAQRAPEPKVTAKIAKANTGTNSAACQ